MDALYFATLCGAFFGVPLMLKRKDWEYDGRRYTAKSTRQLGAQIFVGVFVIVLILWNWNA